MFSRLKGEDKQPPSLNLATHTSSSKTKGLINLLTGRYPAFIWGGAKDPSLPVFHFHEVHRDSLAPYFKHLAENGYHTIDTDALNNWVCQGHDPGNKAVMLHFDDAWSSLWFEAAPLLKQYGFCATVFVSPARIPDTHAPARWQSPSPRESMDRHHPCFCRWSELAAMQADGLIEVQSHGLTHAQIPCRNRIQDWLQPNMLAHPHEIPWGATPYGMRFINQHDLGAPLYPTCSRFSDQPMWIDPDSFAAATAYVQEQGGHHFFNTPSWRTELRTIANDDSGHWESEHEQRLAIRHELVESKTQIEQRLHTKVSQICFPWMTAGHMAEAIAREVGYITAFAERGHGRRTLRAGAPHYRLLRLKHKYIFSLPGQGRQVLMRRNRFPDASAGLKTGMIPIADGTA